jgi:sulfide:quinone oxidoreductase
VAAELAAGGGGRPLVTGAVPRVLVLGAGFGGLELSTRLSEAFGDRVAVTLIDRSDHFVFGYSKLDVMFGKAAPAAVRLPYARILKPGVRFLQQTVTAIDPAARRVTTDGGTFDADYLVVALGADYDVGATPGLSEAGNEFYSVAGAARLSALLPTFTRGRAIVGVCATPFKCPPAPSEAALMLHDFLAARGVREQCEVTLVHPFGRPIPPSPGASSALVAAFAERNIVYLPNRLVRALDPARRLAVLDDGRELPFDLFLGIPKHRIPEVVAASGLAEDGWVAVDPATLQTRFPGVYALGDVADADVPKAGVFAEGAARAVASALVAALDRGGPSAPHTGAGSCYIEFGAGRVGRVDVDFLSGPEVIGVYHGASTALRADKEHFGASRRARWFGL